jgi:hypothetical protein
MSQQDGETTTIDGDTYRVLMLDPLIATDLLADLGKILGPSVAAMASGLQGGGEDQITAILDGQSDVTSSFGPSLERAIREFFERVSKEKQREFIATLAAVTVVVKDNGEAPALKAIFSVHFRGRIGALYKWLAFALKVQFQDFFSSIAPVIAAAGRKAGLAP